MRKKITACLFTALILLCAAAGQSAADKIFLQQKEEGNEAEILEESEDAFIVKIPKEEIRVLKADDPDQIKLWEKKKILWEDQGDYITIFLPKERIAVPAREGDYAKGAYPGKGKAGALKQMLKAAGGEPSSGSGLFLSQGKGKVYGKVLSGARPVEGCRVKIAYVKGQADIFSKLFGGKKEGQKNDGETDMIFEAVTDAKGIYEFNGVPLGDYDIYWLPAGGTAWIRKLSEKPAITVRPGQAVRYPDMDIRQLRR